MNKFQLSYLAAKDYLVALHKFNIRYWDTDEWRQTVDDLAQKLRHDKDTEWMKPYE